MDEVYWSLIHLLLDDNFNEFKTLLKDFININMNYIDILPVEPLLIKAVVLDRVNFINLLIDYGADVNQTYNDMGHFTALHATCLHNNISIIEKLIYNGADVNVVDVWDNTSLFKHVELKHTETVKILLESGANIFGKGRYFDNLLDEIKSLMKWDNSKFVQIKNGYYRLMDEHGNPFKTTKEKMNNYLII